MNFPNTLSVLRIVLSPIFIILFLAGTPIYVQVSFVVYTAAALTDWYDGWYARKYGFKTQWGRFLDPLADKILTSSALFCFYELKVRDPLIFGKDNFIPIGILILIIVLRDIILTAVRSYKELKGQEFRTSYISKTKTFIQMVYIFLIIGLITISVSVPGTGVSNVIFKFLYSELNYYLILIITILTVTSGFAYIFESRVPVKSES